MAKYAKILLPWLLPVTFLAIFFFYPLGSIFSLSFSRADTGLWGPILEALQSGSVQASDRLHFRAGCPLHPIDPAGGFAGRLFVRPL